MSSENCDKHWRWQWLALALCSINHNAEEKNMSKSKILEMSYEMLYYTMVWRQKWQTIPPSAYTRSYYRHTAFASISIAMQYTTRYSYRMNGKHEKKIEWKKTPKCCRVSFLLFQCNCCSQDALNGTCTAYIINEQTESNVLKMKVAPIYYKKSAPHTYCGCPIENGFTFALSRMVSFTFI